MPLSNEFERQLLQAMELQAEVNHDQQKNSVAGLADWFKCSPYKEAMDKGYFSGVITGPGGYWADAIFNAPYMQPIMILEYDTDLLQPEPKEYAEGEETFEPNVDGEKVQYETAAFQKWALEMKKLFPSHYLTAIATASAFLLKDKILKENFYLPIVYCVGSRQSGKTFFFENLIKQINSASIMRYIELDNGIEKLTDDETKNFIVIDEYDNQLPIEINKSFIHFFKEKNLKKSYGIASQHIDLSDDCSILKRSWICDLNNDMALNVMLTENAKFYINSKQSQCEDIVKEYEKIKKLMYECINLVHKGTHPILINNYAYMVALLNTVATIYSMPYTKEDVFLYALGRIDFIRQIELKTLENYEPNIDGEKVQYETDALQVLKKLKEIVRDTAKMPHVQTIAKKALEEIAELHPKDFKDGREGAYASAKKIALDALRDLEGGEG